MTSAEILAEAHGRLCRLGWTNDIAKLCNEGPRCIGLAVADVCWAHMPMQVDNNPRRFLVAAIRERAPQLAEVTAKDLVITWNDKVCADKDEALAVLKRAQELAGA